MRAAWYSRTGPASEVLEVGDLDTPEAGPGEVLVRVRVSGVNPVDVKRRQGGRGSLPGGRVIPHFDGAGEVEAVGEGVDGERVGERVWIYEAQWGRATGCAAEYAVVPVERAVTLPDGVDLDSGACLGIPAMTAHRCVFADGPVSGQTVMVTGGAGAVGRYAIQFAKLGSARVLTTVSSEAKAEIAASAGADEIIDYRREDVAARVAELTGGAGVERIVDVELGANLETSLEISKVNGVIATYASEGRAEPTLPFYKFLYKSLTIRHVLVFQVPEAAKVEALTTIGAGLASGQLSHHVGERYELDDIARAHEAVESGAVGKVLVAS